MLESVECLSLKEIENNLFGFSIKGNCMAPFIASGNKGIIKRVSTEEVSFGDIIAFKKQGKVFVHRVVGLKRLNKKKIFLTKGDLNPLFDSLVEETNLIGKVIEVNGRKKMFLHSPLKEIIAFLSLSYGKCFLCLSRLKKKLF
jgi:signal peptidase I